MQRQLAALITTILNGKLNEIRTDHELILSIIGTG